MSTVIKSTAAGSVAQHIAFNLEDMSQRAAQYVEQVRRQAAQIVVEAQQQAEAVRKRAEEEGRQAAMRAAEKVLDEKVGQRMQTLIPALEKAIREITDAKQSWLAHWERGAVQLSASIAKKIIRREISRDPQITLGLVREALEMISADSSLRIVLHPDDLATLGGQVEALLQRCRRTGAAEMIADPTMEPGDCKVETAFGAVDQRIEAQLERIASELVDDPTD